MKYLLKNKLFKTYPERIFRRNITCFYSKSDTRLDKADGIERNLPHIV